MALDLDLMREKLIARREALAEEDRLAEANRAPVGLDQESVGRLSRMDAMQMQAMAMAQQRRRLSEITAIDAALRRIEEGEYGYCLKCGEDISVARLEHNPAVSTASTARERRKNRRVGHQRQECPVPGTKGARRLDGMGAKPTHPV